ncbi:hypothetical protein [Klebsiella quasipneumoniae]|uniref:hypothetical protein n=1 Tax=Klebsiella quasipneumoniae TaxID=1463165 RepID=UPI002B059D44|nr:hypothetical protein [Klebsiella quasipneumoniae]
MTKSTITRGRLEELAAGQSGFNLRIATHEESQELARMVLAAMDSKTHDAISFDEWSRKCALQITLCYPDFREKAQYIWDSARETQQPAPVVPKEWAIADAVNFCKETGRQDAGAAMDAWNACRAAMLAAAPQEVNYG